MRQVTPKGGFEVGLVQLLLEHLRPFHHLLLNLLRDIFCWGELFPDLMQKYFQLFGDG